LHRKVQRIRKISVGTQPRQTVCPTVSQKSPTKEVGVVSEGLEDLPRKHQDWTLSTGPTGKKTKENQVASQGNELILCD
jgi:hypothetical protein